MCVICIKREGEQFPSEDLIRKMWETNPDGAGFCYPNGEGQVHIEKGFMKLKEFMNRIKELQLDVLEVPVVMHFRIATHGGINQQMCHPFPLTNVHEEIMATEIDTDISVIHNGIISIKPRDGYSDTAEYIVSKLHPRYLDEPDFMFDEGHLAEIGVEIGSRMCFMNGDGDVTTVGKWEEQDGLLFSNLLFDKEKYWKWSSTNYSRGWYDDYDEFDDGSSEYYSFGNDDFYGEEMEYEVLYIDEDGKDMVWSDIAFSEDECIGKFMKQHEYLCMKDIVGVYAVW